MAYYLIQTSYKEAGARALVDHPQSREDQVKKTVASMGGRLHAFFFSFGEYDTAFIVEMPDNVSMAAMSLAASAKGGVAQFRTTVLLTPAEAMEAMKKAKQVDYTPPQ
jgi:uncharacterized protein with GYD domain